MSNRTSTVDDVVGHIEAQATLAINAGTPFQSRHFRLEKVEPALEQIRSDERFSDLEIYDIKGTVGMWNDNHETNYALARKATKQLVKVLQAKNPEKSLEQIFPEMTEQVFWNTRINRFGTTLCSMLQNVYQNSPYKAVKELIDNDPEFESFRDLEPYDMRDSPKHAWKKKNGRKNYALARKATKALIWALRKERRIPFGKVLASIGIDDFRNTPINKHGTTLAGMISNVYEDSPFAAVKDLIDHCYALKRYRDFSPTDMSVAPQHTWKKEDGSLNYELAREQMKKCFDALQARNPELSKTDIVLRFNRDVFLKTPINKYGAVIESMVQSVYHHSLCEALRDLANNDEAYRDLLPAIAVKESRKPKLA